MNGRSWLLPCVLTLMASCGQEIVIPHGSVSGWAYVSGPLVGAVVRAYAVGPDGAPVGEPLGQSAPTGDVVLRIEGLRLP